MIATMSNLSPYEIQDLIWSITAVNYAGLGIHISVLSAYLIVAYAVGKHLSKFQLVSISLIYSAFLLIGIQTLYINYFSIERLISLGGGSGNRLFVYTILTVLVFSWVLSLVFMYEQRRSK